MNIHMQAEEIELFKKWTSKCSSILEFGCGGSTYYLVTSGLAKIETVESDDKWIDHLKSHDVIQKAQECGRLKIHHVDIDASGNAWGYPKTEDKKHNWPVYSSFGENSQEQFDAVLVDGRFRVACALRSFKCIKDDGILIVHDYTNRPHYHVIEKYYDVVDRVETLVIFKKKQSVDFDAMRADIAQYLFVAG